MKRIPMFALSAIALSGCARTGGDPLSISDDTGVHRVRIEEDHVTCYTWNSNSYAGGISCLRDEVPE